MSSAIASAIALREVLHDVCVRSCDVDEQDFHPVQHVDGGSAAARLGSKHVAHLKIMWSKLH